MGWLFAVSNGMFERRARGVFSALPPIAAGHLLAMALVLLPLAAIAALASAFVYVRVIASAVIITFGVYRLIVRRHPRVLARIGAGNLVLWSFVMATAHGAALMLVPVYFGAAAISSVTVAGGMQGSITGGMQGAMGGGEHAAQLASVARAGSSMALAGAVAIVHTVAMLIVATAIAWLFYRYLGLALLNKVWFNVDIVWAVALIIAGLITLIG